MGRERITRPARDLAAALAALTADGLKFTVAMIDGALVMPTAIAPPQFRELRLRTASGMITLTRRGEDLAITVFGNADPALLDAQERLALALETAIPGTS